MNTNLVEYKKQFGFWKLNKDKGWNTTTNCQLSFFLQINEINYFFLKYLVRMAKKQTICLCRLMDECDMLDLEKSGVKPDMTQSKHKCKYLW